MLLSLAEYEQANFSHTFFQELMPTFQEFVETKPAKDEHVANVLRYSEMLCEALLQDYKGKNNGGTSYKFYIESGRKYHKLIMETKGNTRSVHAFVDKNSGAVYKSASWTAPAKGIRFNLLDDDSREECLARCDWAGGYLYM
ncbi:hypothetical protein BJD43_gp173 [Cyanophage S-RIM50]|uniref:Uncharacterized protein n=1 Tax=Cyanophage S-RIM50 TaxID=687803 RepID=A0A127KLD5_9CAUD|nr:hypothetical protein BJD43_gp173 [Cyanophage S-RIM50]AMO42857.1 hypothetical protein R290704_075 [Cyanophage S-RIM50]